MKKHREYHTYYQHLFHFQLPKDGLEVAIIKNLTLNVIQLETHFVPYGLSIIATINLVTFNSALGGAGLFNQKLDGGLGLGWTFNDHVQSALTYEMISFRQPRNYILEREGQTIKVNGSNLTNLPTDDNDYFSDKYLPSISFKVIYILN